MILPAYRRGDLKDHQYSSLQPLLPPSKPYTGRPYSDHRRFINGILWILRTGAPWRDLRWALRTEGLLSDGRFYRWRKKGIWQNILQRLQQQAETAGKINWDIHFVDGSVIRAHQQAAGAIRGELDPNSELSAIEQVQERESLGWSKGGFSTKIHLRCDGNGRPMTFIQLC